MGRLLPFSRTPQTPAREVESLFRAHAAWVANLAARLLGNAADAQDVAQDVFVRAWFALHTLQEPAVVRAWLGSITVNVVTSRLRGRRLKRVLLRRGPHEPRLLPTAASSPQDAALLRQVYAVLEDVPAAGRVAWSLRYLEGERLEAVAQLCGCSLSTAKRRIQAVQQVMEEVFGDE
jgi:RNA polymerase sigma-70 factor, ECF subfamily